MPDTDSKRLFIAVPLDAATRLTLGRIEDDLKKSGADAKWVNPDNIHITLKFLGAVPARDIEEITLLIQHLFKKERTFSVPLDKIDAFPSLTRPRIVCARCLDPQKRISGFAEKIEQTMEKMGFPREGRPFKTHATLARIRSHFNQTALIRKIEDFNHDLPPIQIPIRQMTLFQSQLTPQGPVYSNLSDVFFLSEEGQ